MHRHILTQRERGQWEAALSFQHGGQHLAASAFTYYTVSPAPGLLFLETAELSQLEHQPLSSPAQQACSPPNSQWGDLGHPQERKMDRVVQNMRSGRKVLWKRNLQVRALWGPAKLPS